MPPNFKVVPFDQAEVNGSIIARFRRVALALGDSLALKFEDQSLTFGELEQTSNALAHVLSEVLPNGRAPVALMYKHGNGGIVAQIAVLKLGRCFCCLDADIKPERRNALFSQLGADCVLCDSASLEAALELRAAFPELTIFNTEAVAADSTATRDAFPNPGPDDIACIVNTSGSTGAPKGVMLSHRNMLMTAFVHGQDFQISGADKSFHLCPHSTAAAGSEIFTALLNGSAVFPFSIKDSGIRRFQELIVEEEITTFTASPVLFRLIFKAFRYCERFPSVRLIRLGGDRVTKLDVEIFRERFERHCRLRVGYGSSEYMPALQLFIDRDDAVGEVVPLGYPVQGCMVSLIDEKGAPVAVGEPGEIVVRSRQLSLGYWQDAERTDKAFRSDPNDSGTRTYCTSDMAYRDAEGCFHFIGRKDSIVKINGKQVCVADVERALRAISWLTDAAIVPVGNKQNGTELVAFVVSDRKGVELSHVRASLAADLPYEAMPAKLIALSEIPLTANNKTDLQELKRLCGGLSWNY